MVPIKSKNGNDKKPYLERTKRTRLNMKIATKKANTAPSIPRVV